ncbi:hypothetical protein [Maribellus sp. YY47]|uniref:hypothetical protein n=1 Tax=Maribellus sp. YY47 TaxID=2929486 RepID=UPI002000FC2A|nr:hypothetical protein [Maribellus sp. YY47]MCK3685323.1 hypothetical protein [Maribellus sp. YY47]
MKKQIATTLLLLFSCITLWAQTPAQDSIFTRNGTVILGKVREIGTTEIRYVQPQINEEVVMVILKSEVERIVYANGVEQRFEKEKTGLETIEGNSEDLFAVQRKKALKLDVLGLAVNTLSLTYEQSLRPGRNIELGIGGIGLGFGLEGEHAKGIFLKGGYKFAQNPDHYLTGMRYAHILKGKYVKLEFDFASYSVEAKKDWFEADQKYSITKFAFLVVFGHQWIYDDRLLIDLYTGVGIGTNNLDDNDLSFPYGFATTGSDFPVAASFGLRLGLLIN